MTDPKRLVEGGGLGAELLASARDDGPSRDARGRAAAALGIGLGVATVSTTAGAGAGAGAGAAAATKVVSGGMLAKVIAGGLVVAAVGGGVAVATRAPEPAPVSAPSPPAISIATAAPIAPVVPASTAIDEPEPVPAEPARVVVPTRAPSPPPAKESDLAREVRSLDAVRTASGAAALRELDRHDREFPHGALRDEAAMLRVEALSTSGDEAAARRLARKLLDKDPSGPHAKRLRSILGETP